jgi:hypothetical protein
MVVLSSEKRELKDAGRGSDNIQGDPRPLGAHPTRPGSLPVHRWRALTLSGMAYLALSAFIWSNLWGHPTSETICGCGDPSLFDSFIEWPAYAIAHGLNPFYTTALHYPVGVNLLANTSVLAIGVVLAPVTWLFGPIATLNVASTLAPALSALSMFVLLRRWVSWTPAAFFGGLFYGFSPFIVVALSWAHLMLGMAAIPPLILVCLDELLFRQRHRPLPIGAILGLLVTAQFFVGTEILLIVAPMVGVGIVGVVIYSAWRCPDDLRGHAGHALVGLATGAVTATALLAYPAWFALAGPAHFSGPVWPAIGPSDAVATSATSLRHFVQSTPSDTVAGHLDHIAGGFQGPILSDQYLGIGVLVVLVGGFIIWRRDRRLWLFGAISLISVVLSLGVVHGFWSPWRLLANLPLFEDVYPYRIVFVVYLAVAVMLALIIDHAYQATNRRRQPAWTRSVETIQGPTASLPRWSGAAVGVILGAIAIVPPATYLAQAVPITTQSVNLPDWFRTIAPHMSGRQVLLVLPALPERWGSNDSPMTWQAVDGMNFSMVGVGGPSGILQRTGEEGGGAAVIADVSRPTRTSTLITTSDIAAVGQALAEWGVTRVVIPDQADLPTYDQIFSVTTAAALITAATGRRPGHQENAWVWDVGVTASQRAIPTGARLIDCSQGLARRGAAAVDKVAECVSTTPGY